MPNFNYGFDFRITETSTEDEDEYEPAAKKNKEDSSEDSSDSQREEVITKLRCSIVATANKMLAFTTAPERVTNENVIVEWSKDCYTASVKCPACITLDLAAEKSVITLGFPRLLAPSLGNFKRHFTMQHINKVAKVKSEKGQMKIGEAFKAVAMTKAKSSGAQTDADLETIVVSGSQENETVSVLSQHSSQNDRGK